MVELNDMFAIADYKLPARDRWRSARRALREKRFEDIGQQIGQTPQWRETTGGSGWEGDPLHPARWVHTPLTIGTPPRITDDPDYHYQPIPGGIRDNRPPAVADQPKRPFRVSYQHTDGKTYTVEIFAPTEHDALEHVQSLRLTAMLLGSSVRRAS